MPPSLALPVEKRSRTPLHTVLGWGLAFAGVKIALQVGANALSQKLGYGLFRDEMYYLVCGRHLAWGYVDQPPLVALQARLTELLFGFAHMWSFRLLPAVAGGLTVLLAGCLARALGGGLCAAALAMFGVLTVPVYLALDGFLSMNAWDPVFWMGVALALIELSKDELGATPLSARARWGWAAALGVCGGLGLENKWTLAFFLVSLLAAVLLTRARTLLLRPQLWLAIAGMLAIFAPNLLWQQQHGWPTLVWLEVVRHSPSDVKPTPLEFVLGQWVMLGPLHLPLWVWGAVALCTPRKPWRFAGLAFVLFFLLMMALRAKDYYLAPVYPLLFASGAVAAVEWVRRGPRWRGTVALLYCSAVLAGLAIDLPYALPLLSPATFIKLEHATGFAPKDVEVHDRTLLPQFFADRFGWDELVEKVAAIYNALPPQERARTAIYTRSYGEASAIDVLGARYGLPEALSGHQNFWLWGVHGYTGDEVIAVVHDTPAQMHKVWRSCQVVATRVAPLAMPYERGPIYLCKGIRAPLATLWPGWREWR